MSKSICAAKDCKTPIGKHGAKGYCPKHYKRYKAHGSPYVTTVRPDGLSIEGALRFHGWDVSEDGCWLYRGTLDPDGYGSIAINRRPARVNRVMYELVNGDIQHGLVVRHTCDTPSCVNPDHLVAGTPAQNSRDAVDRKRVANGERHGFHKLTDADVAKIRSLYDTGEFTQRELAKRFSCSQAQVNNILKRKQRVNETYRIAGKVA